MNKILKGSIAGAAGIALLLGGAGTFAVWNSTVTASAGVISSGKLVLTDNADGKWYNTTLSKTTPTLIGTAATNAAAAAAYRIVPGNSVRWIGTLKVEATGNDLTAKLTSPTITALANTFGTGSVTVKAVSSDVAVVAPITGTNDFTVTQATAGTATVTVTLDVVFPTAATDKMTTSVDLSTLVFQLQQNAITGNTNP